MLSERLSPIKYPTRLEYKKTSITFINQTIRIISDLIIDKRMMMNGSLFDSDMTVSNEVCKEFYLQVGEAPDEIGVVYSNEDLIGLLHSAKDGAFLDIVDLVYQVHYDTLLVPTQDTVYLDYIDKQNEIFKRNGIGYSVIGGHLVQIGEDQVLNNITKPCFRLLYDFGFRDASDYLLDAYARFRDGDTEAAILDAYKALESVINGTIEQNNIVVKGSKMSNKIEGLIKNGIIPSYEQSAMNSLVQLINSSGSIRNNTAAHAQNQNNVTDELFEYLINSVTSTIIFIVKSAHR